MSAPRLSPAPRIAGREFSAAEVDHARRTGGLLSLELEMTRLCNLRCTYCYSEAGPPIEDEMSMDEILDAVAQAKALGARKIVILGGGEPFSYADLPELVAHLRREGMAVELFTNGTLIEDGAAAFLYEHEVSVVVKRNSDEPEVQDALAGVPGTFAKIQRGLEALFRAGYPDATHGLGVQTVICAQNLHRLADLWIWARDRGIHPYFECLTVQGRATDHRDLYVPPESLRVVFEELCRLDRERYGLVWTPHPPLVGSQCNRHAYSLYVKANGDVSPCVGVDVPLGNIRRARLATILRESDVVRDLRAPRPRLAGACGSCDLGDECYGCRGNAFQWTGDYLAADPCCWRQCAVPEV